MTYHCSLYDDQLEISHKKLQESLLNQTEHTALSTVDDKVTMLHLLEETLGFQQVVADLITRPNVV